MKEVREFISSQGIAFLSKKDEIGYYKSLVELIENIIQKYNMTFTTSRPLPKYKCHKEVHALKIAGISLPQNESGDAELAFEDERYAPILMKKAWLNKHNPEVGGYYVVYKDGYESYSPAKPFEEGYTRINN